VDDLKSWLRDGDPLKDEPELAAVDVRAIRRAVIVAGLERPSLPTVWPTPLFVAATVTLTLAAGVLVGRRLPARGPAAIESQPRAAAQSAGSLSVDNRRQLEFATPGGTRIIWVFDPEFNP
jgi:hypothetical protein